MPEKPTLSLLRTVAIADDDAGISIYLNTLISHAGYQVVGLATNGGEAVNLVRLTAPQLLLLDLHMPVMDGLQVLSELASSTPLAVIMMTSDPDPVRAREALQKGASGYLQKPCETTQVIPAMESAWHRFQLMQTLQKEAQDLRETLATRKLLDQAKGILMEQQGFSEEQAHRALQKMSQDQGIPVKDVCRSLIQVKMVLGRNAARVAKTWPKS